MARDISVSIPEISSEIFFARMEGEEALSTPYAYALQISCKDMELDPRSVLGTRATVEMQAAGDGSVRYFDGLVADFSLDEIRDDLAFFRLTLRPWLWFLSLRQDNRIFQDLSTPAIIEKVFKEAGADKYKLKLRGTYPPRHYCVQYGETDLAFVQRLMEEEGIFYLFEHDAEGHTLVLVDSNDALKPVEGYETLPYEPDSRVSYLDGDFITHWLPTAQVRSGKFSHTDYDFEKPSFDLTAVESGPLKGQMNSAEVYHHDGPYKMLDLGQKMAKHRLEELQADQLRVRAKGTARHLGAGVAFTLELFPREVENDKYIVTSVRHTLWDEQLRAGQTREATGYLNEVELSPAAVTWRPPRRTPWPRMKGPQTAIVVGPAGAEIYTDKYSRVKVQFHWDRQGKKDENTTCFIRVSAAWAGAGWGFIQIPRIGHEVIVDFLEGDPDQPIITGRVYNAEQTVPYGLPGNASQSGWKSWSTPETGGWNELRFEDKAGAEEVYFQAEKDHVELIKNDETRTIGHDFAEDVGNDAQQSVGHDRTESVGNNKSVTVGNNQTTSIGVNDDETVGSNRSLTVGANETISIGANSTETIGANHTQTVAIAQTITVGAVQTVTVGAARVDSVASSETRTVGAKQTNTIGSDRAMTVGGKESHSIASDDSWQIGGKQAIAIAKDQTLDVGGLQSVKIAKDQMFDIAGAQTTKVAKDCAFDVTGDAGIKSGKTITFTAADAIVLKTGSASISMKKDGTINIEGKDITIKGSGKINVKASSNVIVKGSKILNN